MVVSQCLTSRVCHECSTPFFPSPINFWWRSINSFLRPSGVRWVKWEHLVPRKHHMKQWVFIQREMLEWSRIARSWKKTGPSKLWRSQVFHQRHSLRGLTPICSTPMEFVGVCPLFQKKNPVPVSGRKKGQPLLQKLVTQKQVTPNKNSQSVSQSVSPRGGGGRTPYVLVYGPAIEGEMDTTQWYATSPGNNPSDTQYVFCRLRWFLEYNIIPFSQIYSFKHDTVFHLATARWKGGETWSHDQHLQRKLILCLLLPCPEKSCLVWFWGNVGEVSEVKMRSKDNDRTCTSPNWNSEWKIIKL